MSKELERFNNFIKYAKTHAVYSFVFYSPEIRALKQTIAEYEELKKRDTPLKVEQSWLEEDNHVFECPHCAAVWFYSNDSDEWKLCPNCGQRLGWESEEKNESTDIKR